MSVCTIRASSIVARIPTRSGCRFNSFTMFAPVAVISLSMSAYANPPRVNAATSPSGSFPAITVVHQLTVLLCHEELTNACPVVQQPSRRMNAR